MSENNFITWTVELSVTRNWVEDGFEFTVDKLEDMLQDALPFAYSHEVKAKIIKKPTKQLIKQIQSGNYEDQTN